MPRDRSGWSPGWRSSAIAVGGTGLCVRADLSARAGRRLPACRCELRARALHRRHEPRPRRPRRDRRAARTQRPVCRDRQRDGGGGDGRRRIFLGAACGFFCDRGAARSDAGGAEPDPSGRGRSGSGARRAGAAEDRSFAGGCAHRRSQAAAPDPGGLRLAVPHGQRLDAAAHGQRGDDALERMGDRADRGVHRGAAGGRRPRVALGRAPRRDLGPPSVPALGVCGAGVPRAAVSPS